MLRTLRPIVTTCLAMACGSLIPQARAVETFEVVHTASPVGSGPSGAILAEDDGSFVVTSYLGGTIGTGGVFRVANGAVNPLASFLGANGTYPAAGVIKASDTNYYGTTEHGGIGDAGTVFRVTPTGVLTSLASLAGTHGSSPRCQLVEGADGALYGVGSSGGAKSLGTVFKVTKAGRISTLVHFQGASNGAYPEAGLTKAGDGSLYGVTIRGGANDKGIVYRIGANGVFSVVASFNGANGENPLGSLTLGSDGSFYGTTFHGGATNQGTIFRVTAAGELTVVASFAGANGVEPYTRLTELGAGNFYGVTRQGGESGGGVIFKVTSAGTISVVAQLPVGARFGRGGALIAGSDGALYSVGYFGGANNSGELYRVTPEGAISTVASFGNALGQGFVGNLAKSSDGALYGTTSAGGSDGLGTFFKITTAGAFSRLSDFKYLDNGGQARSGVILGQDGNFYGTFNLGSAGAGLFRATPAGEITRLASFSTIGGNNPVGLIQASDGTFYGATQSGEGANSQGLIYSYAPQGELTKLKVFEKPTGAGAAGKLLEGRDGNFYGVSPEGGAANAGTIYRISPNGQFTLLASFNGRNGANPVGSLVQAPDGNFYGVTFRGGVANAGVVFRVTPAGRLAAIAHFIGRNGAFPQSGLTVGTGGNLYGSTVAGGTKQLGVLYKVSLRGRVTVLHNFDGATSGAFPTGNLTIGPDANLYGTSSNTIFRLKLNNRQPVLKDDIVEFPGFNIRVLQNDFDPDGDRLQIIDAQPSNDTDAIVRINSDNTITYIPQSGELGETRTFTYTVTDGITAPVTATVTVRPPLNLLRSSAGVYAGLITGESRTAKGYWAITVNARGLYTGILRYQGTRYTVRGSVVDGEISITIPRTGGSALTITAVLDARYNLIEGTLADGTTSYELTLYGNKPFFTRTSPTLRAGKYTVLLPPNEGNNLPQGTGYATMNVSVTGAVSVVGKLGDGTPFSTGSALTMDEEAPFYAELYTNPKGYLAGSFYFSDLTNSETTGSLIWVKPAQAGAYYPEGFTTSTNFLASRYVQPALNATVLPFKPSPNNAQLELTGTGIEKPLSVSPRNVVSVPSPGADRISMVIDPRSGLFTGRFVDPADNTFRTFGGAVFQKTGMGEGTYFSKSTTGSVLLTPVP